MKGFKSYFLAIACVAFFCSNVWAVPSVITRVEEFFDAIARNQLLIRRDLSAANFAKGRLSAAASSLEGTVHSSFIDRPWLAQRLAAWLKAVREKTIAIANMVKKTGKLTETDRRRILLDMGDLEKFLEIDIPKLKDRVDNCLKGVITNEFIETAEWATKEMQDTLEWILIGKPGLVQTQ